MNAAEQAYLVMTAMAVNKMDTLQADQARLSRIKELAEYFAKEPGTFSGAHIGELITAALEAEQ